MCKLDDDSFLVTGSYQESGGDQCELYNTREHKWTQFPTLNHARRFHSSCRSNNKVFVVGGYKSGTIDFIAGGGIECLDMSVKREDWAWEVVKQDPILQRYSFGLIMQEDQMVIFGGVVKDWRDDMITVSTADFSIKQLENKLPNEYYTYNKLTVWNKTNNQIVSFNEWNKSVITFAFNKSEVLFTRQQLE
jgi:hypothetical protein